MSLGIAFFIPDPTILVQIFGSSRGYDQTSLCTVRASLGSPSISLSEDGEEDYKLSTLVTNTDYPSHGVYQHGSVFVDTSQFRSGNLTCLVTDTLGTYHKTIGISREGKWRGNTLCGSVISVIRTHC